MRIKTLVFTVAFLSISFSLFAEAPELQYVMPNSWKKITRLSETEELKFLQENRAVLDKIANETDLVYSDKLEQLYVNTSVYREQVGKDTFYRLIISDERIIDYNNSFEISFVHALVYDQNGKMLLIGAIAYNHRGVDTRHEDWYERFSTFTIIHDKDKAIGVMASSLICYVDINKNICTSILKNQIYGFDVMAYYFLMSDVRNIKKNVPLQVSHDMELYLCDEKLFSIQINASNCLIDSKSPLRYGIQSAFDGDPATSYVENTEGDLMEIWIYENPQRFKRSAIINGFAQNLNLYKNNNRIKSLWVDSALSFLKDDTLSYQFVNQAHQCLYISDIYKGDKYNDTCIAEYNVYIDGIGWLFGDIDE
jgi:hypothetical protein